MNEKANPQYWVVGASWEGHDHQDEEFVKNGLWMLGWEEGHQHESAKEMNIGDRIAIKRMRGKGQTGLLIRHVGIIKGVMLDTSNIVCVVDWVAPYLDRVVSESRAVSNPFMVRMGMMNGCRRSFVCEWGRHPPPRVARMVWSKDAPNTCRRRSGRMATSSRKPRKSTVGRGCRAGAGVGGSVGVINSTWQKPATEAQNVKRLQA